MAIHHTNVTLGAGATQAIAAHTPCKMAIIYNDTGNAAVKVGDKNITATSFGAICPVSAVGTGINGMLPIGPFSGEQAFNLDEIWFFGTQNNIIHILYVT